MTDTNMILWIVTFLSSNPHDGDEMETYEAFAAIDFESLCRMIGKKRFADIGEITKDCKVTIDPQYGITNETDKVLDELVENVEAIVGGLYGEGRYYAGDVIGVVKDAINRMSGKILKIHNTPKVEK